MKEVIAGKRDRIEFELFGESDGMASAQANGGSAKAATLHHDGSVWIAEHRLVLVVCSQSDYSSLLKCYRRW
ncbi:hypothetical protein [Alishewanella longhuensis]